MLTDSPWPALVSFLLLLAAGIGNLWTGRTRIGFFEFSLAWILGDAALLTAYVLDVPSGVLPGILIALHFLGWFSFLRFVFLRVRRRKDSFQGWVEERYRKALQAWMVGADDEVVPLARGLLKKDPWCFPALVLLAKVAFVSGKKGKALRWARIAASLARDPDDVALIEEEVLWAVPKKKPPTTPKSKPNPKGLSPQGPEEHPKNSRKLRAKGA
jgi:hypothetical protein